ncbi:hypothetical protein Nepgr_001196 [Nepenthes gracilis]|uniref:Uncharacterized protein n=1 Tax=Nepenthes gracilis TaxID=150966 RepID=A0AAD3RVX2_NEPGR|nr:hypothetical protein Nepgr_001196 [Nepenthes gracilis]
MNGGCVPKKLKTEAISSEEGEAKENGEKSCSGGGGGGGGSVSSPSQEDDHDQEEALIALIEHRTKEVEHLRRRVSYYQSQLEEMEKRLHDSNSKLARLRCRNHGKSSRKDTMGSSMKELKLENRSISPIKTLQGSSKSQSQSKTRLLIPGINPKSSQPIKLPEAGMKASASSRIQADVPSSRASSGLEDTKSQAVGAKRKTEFREHKELIPVVRSSSLPCLVRCNSNIHISSQHKRKMRSLSLSPLNDKLFITSALDGMVNLWQLQIKGSGATLLSSTDCVSHKQRRWPEDIAWHPAGNKLFAVYTADGGDDQISMVDLNKSQGRERVTFLEEKPHLKGIINSIMFMPWDDDVNFITGGSDHAVVLWNETAENIWKPKTIHRNLHSSAVMGVAGMQHKKIVMSVGADKRIIGYDLLSGRADYKHQIESKCMSILPNPCDFNLLMVQTGTPERQLRLYDIRLRQTEVHAFGWRQESSESQSALINQSWSPDGLYISSGSADPMIHIFDIRYNAHKPSQSVQAHQKRVFKAVWHSSIPLLTSISSDLNIGFHKIS